MPIYKLNPIKLDASAWASSDLKGDVLVRAKSEREARDLAEKKYFKATSGERGREAPVGPWNDGNIVSCEVVKDSGFPEDGEPEILSR